MKFLCIESGASMYTGPVLPAASCWSATRQVCAAIARQGSRKRVRPSRARPERPTAQPTTSAPATDSQAWNHSTTFALNGLTSTVKRVATW